MILPQLVCGLVILGACYNLWWFAFASAAVLMGLHYALVRARLSSGIDERRWLRLSTATLLCLTSYALLLSIAILTTRAALGLLELPIVPVEQAHLAPAMRRSSMGFYDKSELRLALSELAFIAVTLSLVFVHAASHWALRRGQALVLHPASAAFAFVLYFAAVRLPPYPIHLEQWVPLVTQAATDNAWSMVGVSPLLLAAWLSWFGLSSLSLAMAAALCNLVAGWASFVLMRRLTGSPVAAMFGASCALLETTALHADSVTLPAPAHVALALLLMHLSLHPRAGFPWAVLVLGFVLALDPLFGASASAGFLFALGCQRGRPARLRVLAALLAGIGVSVAAIAIARNAFAPLPLLSAAPIAEEVQFLAPALPLFIPVLLLLAVVLRRSGDVWTARHLFVCASLVTALASAGIATARVDSGGWLQMYWILLATVVFAFYGLIRAIARAVRAAPMRMGTALSTGVGALIFVVLFDILFPIERFNQIVARYAVRYEFERHRWYKNCASGKVCNRDQKPTLAFYLREAARPLADSVGAKRDPA